MAARQPGKKRGETAPPKAAKVTLSLSVETAQRLGVEASMRRVTMSFVAEEVLSAHLKRWRLPSTIEDPAAKPTAAPARDAEEAA